MDANRTTELGLEELLRCPACSAEPVERRNDELVCAGCGRRYPVTGGIPRFVHDLGRNTRQVQRVFDFEHRRFADSWYTRFEPRLSGQFLEDCELPANFFAGRLALDAGCGSGRWTYALAELGADVVAFDLTAGGVESAQEEIGTRPNVQLCQADIFSLPFKPSTFDFVLSWGVLHHTPDTKAAFDRLVPLVKPGGTLYVMVYERLDGVRFFLTTILRWLLRRFSDERRYELCRHLVIRNARLERFLSRFLIVSYYDPENPSIDPKTLQFGLFDAYSPRFNHLHTRDEVARWFAEGGFSTVTVLDSPRGSVKILGTRRG